jgi:hypothetical protein
MQEQATLAEIYSFETLNKSFIEKIKSKQTSE